MNVERAGGGVLVLDLSGVRLRLVGLSADLESSVRGEWSRFLAEPGAAEPFLTLALEYDEREVAPEAWAPKSMRCRRVGEGARFELSEGSAELEPSGVARLRLASGLGPREFYTLANLLRACLAWRMPGRGGLLLHAAGLVLQGRAFLLVGAESSGKSTWARIGEQSGARVLSDDLVVVDGVSGSPEALGTPLRSTHVADYRPGRWPLAAVLFPLHGSPAALGPVPDLIATARLTANLPFVADTLAGDERVAGVVDRIRNSVICAELTFAPDPAFIDLLRGMPA